MDYFQSRGHQLQWVIYEDFQLIKCHPHLYIHPVHLKGEGQPAIFIKLQEHFQKKGVLLIHLWEDIWINRRFQVLNRLYAHFGLNQVLHGRETLVKALPTPLARQFFETYHLQGYVKSSVQIGLFKGEELVAASSFNKPILLPSKGKSYYSSELTRFATKAGVNVSGGFSKLLRHYVKKFQPTDIMTYADRDWSLGEVYKKLHFELTETQQPWFLYVHLPTMNRFPFNRLPLSLRSTLATVSVEALPGVLKEKNYCQVFNTGNLKYHLYLR